MREHYTDLVLKLKKTFTAPLYEFFTQRVPGDDEYYDITIEVENFQIILKYIYGVQLIKRDDLQMKEVEVWEHLLKWGLAQNPTLLLDPDTWSDEDFRTMENALQHCLPLNNNAKDAIISNVENTKCAIYHGNNNGPCFGDDIVIFSSKESTNYSTIVCKKSYYEKKMRDKDGVFSIEDYEVFQIT
ncbi:BTB/POZ protein [Rhizophagus irregularis DAOM 181602=DAOM 197198]|nr:BTB/POZ protein [Rhizophagus irregularis DAOM 181602=DAOM 197198]